MPFDFIDFTTFADVPNPDGLPAEWPADSKRIVSEEASVTFAVNHRLPIAEYFTYLEARKPAYQARVDELQAAQDAAEAAAALAAREAAEPDLVLLRNQAQSAIDTNATFSAIVGTPTNAQVLAQIRALTIQNTKIIKALVRLAIRAI